MKRRLTTILLPVGLAFLAATSAPAQQTANAASGSASIAASGPMALSLTEAIHLALKQNRDLQLARLSVGDSEHKKQIARSAYFPNIKNQSSILHITDLAGVEIPAGAFGNHPSTGAIPGNNLFLDQGALTSYTSGTGLTQPLTQMFKIRESNRAASADIASAKIQVDQAENEVALAVRQLYDGILIAQLKQQAAQEEVAASRVQLQESADAVEKGSALEVANLESRASLLDAQDTVLTAQLQLRDLTLTLNDLLGLPLETALLLNSDSSSALPSIPDRAEGLRIAREHSPEIRSAEQTVVKARAGLAAAKDAYIPDVTGMARYSYQDGVPLLVHNFGTFGLSFSYELFDGGRRPAEIKDARTLLAQAELSRVKAEEAVAVQVEKAYDQVEQLRDRVGVAEEVLHVRTEAARLSDRRFEQTAALASVRSEAHAKSIAAQAALIQARLDLSLANGTVIKVIGLPPQ